MVKVLLAVSIFLLCCSAVVSDSCASWFGPSNYDECILDGMENVDSDVAAKLVAQSCRKKFPINKNSNNIESLSDDIVDKIDGKAIFNSKIRAIALNEEWSPSGVEYLSGDLFNNNDNWFVVSLIVRIMDKDSDTYRDYDVAVKQDNGAGFIPPLSKGKFYFEVYSVTKNWSWSIVGGSGYRK